MVLLILLPSYCCLMVIKWLLPLQTSYPYLRQNEHGREKGGMTSMVPFSFEKWKLPESLCRFLFVSYLPELRNVIPPTFKESWGNKRSVRCSDPPTNICVPLIQKKWGMDLTYSVNMCLFFLNSLSVTSLPKGSSDSCKKTPADLPRQVVRPVWIPAKSHSESPLYLTKVDSWQVQRLNYKYQCFNLLCKKGYNKNYCRRYRKIKDEKCLMPCLACGWHPMNVNSLLPLSSLSVSACFLLPPYVSRKGHCNVHWALQLFGSWPWMLRKGR